MLAEKEQASFEVLTAITVNHGLIMQLENKSPHFAVSIEHEYTHRGHTQGTELIQIKSYDMHAVYEFTLRLLMMTAINMWFL